MCVSRGAGTVAEELDPRPLSGRKSQMATSPPRAWFGLLHDPCPLIPAQAGTQSIKERIP